MSDISAFAHSDATEFERTDLRSYRSAQGIDPREADTAVVGIVLAGGEGTRLAPLTARQAKPAVPFGARHRIIDFALSNLVNSGIRSLYVLVQHHGRSVSDHVRSAWHTVPDHGFVNIVQPSGRSFRGTADAVRQSLERLQVHSADLVLIFGADHVYRMDVSQMIAHHRACRADVTVAALPVPRDDARSFGVIDCDADGRILGFLEKPSDPPTMPGRPNHCFASMGNYCFTASALLRAMQTPTDIQELDFGRHVLPRMLQERRRVFAYDFNTNVVPGLIDHESAGYWRDVGTLDAYFQSTLDTLGDQPAFELDNPLWPIRLSRRAWPPARLVRAQLHNAQIGAGALVRDAAVTDSVVRRAALIDEDADVQRCVVLDGATIGKGARLRNVIVTQGVAIPPQARIGFDPELDRRLWTVTSTGLTVVSQP